jgi:hypothetical protein
LESPQKAASVFSGVARLGDALQRQLPWQLFEQARLKSQLDSEPRVVPVGVLLGFGQLISICGRSAIEP